jgi:peptide deformylase
MAILNLLYYPDKRLYLKAKKVTTFDKNLEKLVDDMAETMYHNDGCGLAATQVNVLQQVIVVDPSPSDEESALMALINPVIVAQDGQSIRKEGCLSVPLVYEEVVRAMKVKVEYQTITGKAATIECEGLLAVILQHEIDHLHGKVFVDYLSNLKQNFIRKKLKKYSPADDNKATHDKSAY